MNDEQKAKAIQCITSLINVVESQEKDLDHVCELFIEVCKHINPEWKSSGRLLHLLKTRQFPLISGVNGDLRINGRMTEKNSFENFLKEIM